MNSVYGGAAIDLVIVCLLCTGALWLVQRFDAKGDSILWAVVAIILIKRIGDFAVGVAWQSGVSERYFVTVHALVIAFSVAGPLLWLFWRSLYARKAVPIFRGFLAAAGFCILWVLPQLIYMAVHAEPHDVQKFARAVSRAHVPQRRVVWIVFDELSQDQVFDHRQPGISLPELDKFRSRSVMFSDVHPAGFYTEDVLPSLLWGKVLGGIRSDLTGDLYVKNSGRWQRFPEEQSIFADARREGWSTGVAGWYVPYCRTYRQSLDWCAWVWRSNIPSNYSPEKTVWWNVNAPLIRLESKLTRSKYPVPSAARNHANDYTDIMRWSHELIDDENIGIVFLHLPLPHPFGFYNRRTGQLGVDGTYLDSLVLSDRSLGEIMQWINETNLASKTTVIVCSDHSWRLPIWRLSLTQEEKKALGGRFDTRPVLMVHFPGETEPDVVSKPFAAIKEHGMVESLLRQPMTAAGLEDWASKQ